MQYDQFKGMADRAAAVIATAILGWMVNKGWIGESDATVLLPGVVLLPSLIWGAWVNRDTALISSAGNVVDPHTGKKAIILTSPEIAAATPGQNNIISSGSSKEVIAKALKAQS